MLYNVIVRGDYMEAYSVIILVFAVILLGVFVVLYFVNRLVQYRNRIEISFVSVKEILDDRSNIVLNMIEFLDKNLEHEKSYRKKLEKSRDLIMEAHNNKDGILMIKKAEKDIFSFVNLDNTYSNLVKNKEYLKIKEEVLHNKERLCYAMDSYDKGVISYNNYKENKFVNFLSKLFRFSVYDCYNK